MNWYQLIREDFSVVFERDPATRSRIAVLTLHTGFWAVACYRMQHALWKLGLRWLARWLSLLSRWLTGVEIHPPVKAGRRLFIDVVGVPARAVRVRREDCESFTSYGVGHDAIPDPIATLLEQLNERVAKLEAENAALRQRHD